MSRFWSKKYFWSSLWWCIRHPSRIWTEAGKYPLKYRWQRLRKGYSSLEVWNIGYATVKTVLPWLKEWRTWGPSGYPNIDKNTSEKNWPKTIDKIIAAFQDINDEEVKMTEWWAKFKKLDRKGRNKIYKMRREGCELFGKYLMAMWD